MKWFPGKCKIYFNCNMTLTIRTCYKKPYLFYKTLVARLTSHYQ